MSRTPTDRARAWAHWRERLSGVSRGITLTPECGLYKAKLFGRFVAVQIDIVQSIDPVSGELVADERLSAWVDGKETDPDVIWSYCADSPITQREFDRLKRAPVVTDLSRSVIV